MALCIVALALAALPPTSYVAVHLLCSAHRSLLWLLRKLRALLYARTDVLGGADTLQGAVDQLSRLNCRWVIVRGERPVVGDSASIDVTALGYRPVTAVVLLREEWVMEQDVLEALSTLSVDEDAGSLYTRIIRRQGYDFDSMVVHSFIDSPGDVLSSLADEVAFLALVGLSRSLKFSISFPVIERALWEMYRIDSGTSFFQGSPWVVRDQDVVNTALDVVGMIPLDDVPYSETRRAIDQIPHEVVKLASAGLSKAFEAAQGSPEGLMRVERLCRGFVDGDRLDPRIVGQAA